MSRKKEIAGKTKRQMEVRQVRENRIDYKTSPQKKFHIAEYPVVVNKSRYGYDVTCPILPGCASQGETLEEALENIKSAIREYLDAICKVKKRERIIMVGVPV